MDNQQLQAEKQNLQSEIADLNIKKSAIHDDIETYGKSLETLKKSISDAQSKLVDVGILRPVVDECMLTISNLKTDIANLTAQKTMIQNEIVQYTQSLQDKTAFEQDIQNLENKKSAIINEIEGIDAHLSAKTAEKENLDESIKITSAKNDEVNASHIANMKKFDEDYFARKAELDTDIASLTKIKEMLSSENDEADKKRIEKTKALEVVAAQISQVQLQLTAFESTYATRKQVKEKELSDMQTAADKREVEQNKRDGDLSLKDASLEIKKNKLILAKQRIEKEVGRAISIDI